MKKRAVSLYCLSLLVASPAVAQFEEDPGLGLGNAESIMNIVDTVLQDNCIDACDGGEKEMLKCLNSSLTKFIKAGLPKILRLSDSQASVGALIQEQKAANVELAASCEELPDEEDPIDDEG